MIASARVLLHDPEDPQARVLQAVLRTILTHPVAAQAAFSALVAEGRRAAQSPDGAALLARIEGSELTERLRLVWEAASLGALDADAESALPDALVETFISIAARGDLETFLARWLVGAEHGGAA